MATRDVTSPPRDGPSASRKAADHRRLLKSYMKVEPHPDCLLIAYLCTCCLLKSYMKAWPQPDCLLAV
jgi:hypothetical protein